jgi:hypothetical protein
MGCQPAANVDVLASTEICDVEKTAGMALLDGIPVRLEPVAVGSPRLMPEVGVAGLQTS